MNFVKANIYLIVCGVLILVAIGAIFWPIGSYQSELAEQMKSRVAQVGAAKNLTRVDIALPGSTPFKGAVEKNVITARNEIQTHMKEQANKIALEAATKNGQGRVSERQNEVIPLLWDVRNLPPGQVAAGAGPSLQEFPQFLPIIKREWNGRRWDGYDFKDLYVRLPDGWVTLLSGTTGLGAAVPTAAEVQAAFQLQEAKSKADAAVDRAGNPLIAPPMGGNLESKAQMDFARSFVSNRADSIRMYVTPDAFHIEPWSRTIDQPDEVQIFEAFVRCWIQQDIVNAIRIVNDKSKNVGQSAVKRLDKIIVGGTSGQDGTAVAGALFVRGATPTASFDPTKSMTGRVSSADYDVVWISLRVVIDPKQLNAFADALYRQNTGYTILNVRQRVVDPYEAAGNGYLFGETQCVEAEIQIESLMFRKWTVPLMPGPVKTALGIQPAPAK